MIAYEILYAVGIIVVIGVGLFFLGALLGGGYSGRCD